jgi:hypothetical protein
MGLVDNLSLGLEGVKAISHDGTKKVKITIAFGMTRYVDNGCSEKKSWVSQGCGGWRGAAGRTSLRRKSQKREKSG